MSRVYKEIFAFTKKILELTEKYEQKKSFLLLAKYNKICLDNEIVNIDEFKQRINKGFELAQLYVEEIDFCDESFKIALNFIECIHTSAEDYEFDNYYDLFEGMNELTKKYYVLLAKLKYLLSISDYIANLKNFEISLDWMNQITLLDIDKSSIIKQIEETNISMQEIYDSL